MEKQLQQLGLSKNESKIYLALVENGSLLAGAISRKTGIHRRSVYDSVERLIEKGLVSYILKNNKKYFEAVNPTKLLSLLDEKRNIISELLPVLESQFNSKKEKQETLFFRGKQALKSIFEDQLKEGKEIFILGASANAYDVLKYYFKFYDLQRQRRGINAKIIFDFSARGKIKKIPNAEIRYLPKDFSSPAATNIYGDKVAIILWSENPIAILIHQKEIADSYRNYFNLLWKSARL